MKSKKLLRLMLTVSLATTWIELAPAVESIHYGLDGVDAHPQLTDALRLSKRIGQAWWVSHAKHFNPENGAAIPYAYHDGYVEWVGETNRILRGQLLDTSPAACALRWHQIKTGQGDSWTGEAGAQTGTPEIIVLDEINSGFKDHLRGPALREALRIYTTQYGDKKHIVLLASPGLSMGQGVVAANYGDVIYCANHYVRSFGLELYCSFEGFMTGTDPGGQSGLGTGDAYLANRLAFGLRNWTTTMGVKPAK
ncbi:MAG: hypothetical protein EXS35_18315 [Pedosphaera sp.]|nr:hypothetical protein [Pedosphaera sp.]